VKRVLVTGARGFIGRHCVPLLAERGYEVHAVSSKQDGQTAERVVWHRVDLLDYSEAAEMVRRVKPDRLLHLAWCTTPGEYWSSAANVSWLTASVELLRSFAEYGERAVVAGTCAEYDWSSGMCVEDVTPIRPESLYGICKNNLRAVGAHIAAQSGFEFAWGRIFHLFGPYEARQRLLPSVINSLLAGQPVACTNPNKLRDFLYVTDVAEAFVSLLEGTVAGVVNVASGAPVSLGAVVEQVAAMIGRPELVRWGAATATKGDPDSLLASARRLREEVGWSPRWTLEESLRHTLEWWREGRKDRGCE
jgi:nucleoside-diphosphate-sugar epimerase